MSRNHSTSVLPPFWQLELGEGPLVACAVHHGHAVRPEVAALMRLDAAERRYEEDPFTGDWTSVAPTRFIGHRSRFEVDFNRPRESAVYLDPDDAWGLDLWHSPPPREIIEQSLAAYDAFYAHLRLVLDALVRCHRRVVVLDLHSYNHRRDGPNSPPEDPRANPEINVGTGSLDRESWIPIVDRCLDVLRSYDYMSRRLDVRENVRFRGGELPKWTHRNYPGTVCALALEVKKFWMDEWTGNVDRQQHRALHQALEAMAATVLDEL
jgi:N-formylglutamate deformylase